MSTTPYDGLSVGEIAAQSPSAAAVLDKFHIDFCCHGKNSFRVACGLALAEPSDVAAALDAVKDKALPGTPDFKRWPTDLLCDYVLKIHHRQIREEGPRILKLLDKVVSVHGANHPELTEIARLFKASFEDLSQHLLKEENILFPYVYTLCAADLTNRAAPAFQCADGHVASPIRVMEAEHANEGERHDAIEKLTNNYTPPADACSSYTLLIAKLKDFRDALHEHIHIENNLIFPRSIELEAKRVQ